MRNWWSWKKRHQSLVSSVPLVCSVLRMRRPAPYFACSAKARSKKGIPAIVGPNIVIVIFSLTFFWGIFMMWFSFVRYFTSNDMSRVREAETNAEESVREEKSEGRNQMAGGDGLSPETMQHISQAVERWLASGGYLKAGITSPMAADAMNIPRYQLTAWVKASGHTSFTRWMTSLRIEEAKRMILEHRDWTNEAIADHCGFSRAYFQKIFKQETGMAPAEYGEK